MNVVSNTSPLTNLAAIGRFGLLEQLYAQVSIAEGVWSELNAFGHIWPGREQVAAATWVSRQTVRNTPLVEALRRDLDQGKLKPLLWHSSLKPTWCSWTSARGVTRRRA